jgi:glycosyltransferase involved in cell wall biosynthesis
MRILIISHFFPPYNSIGAVRVGKIAKYLRQFGHDVRVLTTMDQPLQATLPLDIPKEEVIYTSWINVNRPVELVLGGRGRVAVRGYTTGSGTPSLIKRLGLFYKNLTNLPDGQIGWYPYAVAAGRRLLQGWRPDVIYASAMPVTSLLVADALARDSGIPWVAELRDLWMDNPYLDLPVWRRRVERRLEARVIGAARGLVTISEPLAETLRRRFAAPVEVVTNGFDPEDYPVGARPASDGVVRIVHTGMIYEGRRDPSPLFQALAELGEGARQIRLAFYGRYLSIIEPLAERYGVRGSVEIHDPVPHREALRIQAEADILLLLLWNDTREKGSFTGKVFEYLGARRPILVIGPSNNVASRLIVERGVGVVETRPTALASLLSDWICAKKNGQLIPGCSSEATVGFSREDQTRVLARFLSRCAGRVDEY